jgi:DNA polymerase-4
MDAYSRYSTLVSEIIDGQAPVFEKSSIDEFYLDLTGMDRYFGCFKWSAELRERIIKESGLPISCALSINKLVSKVAPTKPSPMACWRYCLGKNANSRPALHFQNSRHRQRDL